MRDRYKILFVSAEVSPFAKTGGLADVAGSLPKALAAMGNDVRIAMPRYRMIKQTLRYAADFPVRMDNGIETCIIREGTLGYKADGVDKDLPVYFTDSYRYFDRDGIYCHFDDADRFIFFCKAVLEMLPKINFQPDVIHCNDWHTGPVCMLLKEHYNRDSFYDGIKTVYTIHNLEYQGNFPADTVRLFNLDHNVFTTEKTEFYGAFSFMKAGLAYADKISTVSKMYAGEIQTPQYGELLEGLLSSRSADLYGIVNGISYEEFDPTSDPRIYKNYGIKNRADKKLNKTALQKEMGLPERNVPVIGLISRLSGQKGLDLIIDRIDGMMAHDMQFVLLGTGDEYYENIFRGIEAKYPEKVAVDTSFNTVLAQRIYAGCDMFLMPSRFEPCGLGQIISMRYGTIPIVRATGGLAETVTDCGTDRENGNGFSFAHFDADEMLGAIERALKLYDERPEEWDKLVVRALSRDNSWSGPAKEYVKLYKLAVGRKPK